MDSFVNNYEMNLLIRVVVTGKTRRRNSKTTRKSPT